jgi:hypothetical protein
MSTPEKIPSMALGAQLAIFPSMRRSGMIQRAAALAAASKNPENTIRAAIERARASHVRKGLPPDSIRRDITDLETALRNQVAFLLRYCGVAR